MKVSDTLEELFGWKAEQVQGMHLGDLVSTEKGACDPSGRAGFRNAWQCRTPACEGRGVSCAADES